LQVSQGSDDVRQGLTADRRLFASVSALLHGKRLLYVAETGVKFWLMKSEPRVFSFEDLIRSPGRTTTWEGVRNYQARNLMRDESQKGDRALIYHSGIAMPIIMGIAEVLREGYPDSSATDPKSRYFDSDTRRRDNPWIAVDVRAVEKFQILVTRELLKNEAKLKKMMVLKRGARLSVQPVTEAEFAIVRSLGKAKRI
jgi:predicted RNA-binding protein with PUA-like domain